MGKNKPPHILIIRLSAMGDVAMLVPVLSKLINTHPSLKISLLTRPYFAPIFSSFSNVTIIKADVKGTHNGFFGLYTLFKELKRLEITSVADVHNVLRSKILKLFFRTNKIPVVQIDKGRKEKKALTKSKNKTFKLLKTTHQRYAEVFARLGFPVDLGHVKLLEKLSLRPEIIKITGDKNHKWIGIAPFAAHDGKMYPLELMKEVVSLLVKEKTNKILLFGGGAREATLLNKIENRHKNTVLSCAGKLDFKDELALISNLDVMLSMDSGNAHLAANYGIPVLTLWGVTHPFAGFAPFGQPEENMIVSDRVIYPMIPTSVYGNHVPKGYKEVMTTILPTRVSERIEEILQTQSQK